MPISLLPLINRYETEKRKNNHYRLEFASAQNRNI